MVDAPNTSQYLLALADIGDLPNSLVLIPDVPNGIQFVNSGPGTTLQITTPTGSNLRQLQTLDLSGILSFDTSGNTFTSRTIVGDGTTISVANGTGVAGNPTISTIAGGSVQLTQIAYNGTLQSTRPTLNFSATGGLSVTVQDDVGTNSANIILGLATGGTPIVSLALTTTSGLVINPTGAQTGIVSIAVDTPFQVKGGAGNVCLGTGAGSNITSGISNLLAGTNAGNSITGDSYIIALGQGALQSLISGNPGTIGIGTNALQLMVSGAAGTIAIGPGSGGTQNTYNQCTFFGADTDSTVNNLVQSGAFGYNTKISTSNAINIGSGINLGINQASPASTLHISGGKTAGTTAIQIQSSTVIPTAPGASNALIYVASSTSTNADQLWFQPGVGSAVNLAAGGGGGAVSSVALTSTYFGITPTGAQTGAVSINVDPQTQFVYTGFAFSGTSLYIGPNSGAEDITTGGSSDSCVGLGSNTLYHTTGNGNVGIGGFAGHNFVGIGCTFIGANSDGPGSGIIYGSMALGYKTSVQASRSVNISGYDDNTSLSGVNIGINQSTPLSALHISAGIVANTAAIQIDNTSASAPAAPGAGSGLVYIASSTGTNADQLWFQPGVGSAVNLAPQTGTYNFSFVGIWAISQACTASYVISGNICSVSFSNVGSPASISSNIVGNFPSYLQPSMDSSYTIGALDNGTYSVGTVNIFKASSSISINPTISNGSYSGVSALGNSGFRNFTITYTIL
jgi:hypothetical protein